MARLALIAAAAAAPFLFAAPAHADAQSCVNLIGSDASGAVIDDAIWFEPGALGGPMADLPAFCEVWGTIAAEEGSRIGVVYRLPDAEFWNGRLLGLGGGGWSGNIAAQTASDGLGRGYATMQTDTGHPVPEGFGAFADDWVLDADGEPRWPALTDFAWRAIHLMTVAGKSVAADYYGRPQDRAYFQGCSTGGRQALMEAQRFPEDYDAIIAGAPVLNMTVQSSSIMRSNLFILNPARVLSPAQLALVERATMAQCDADDGLQDGVISRPFACQPDAAALACAPGASGDDCLTPQQVFAVQTMHQGVRTPQDGTLVAHPALPGSEGAWAGYTSGQGSFEVNQSNSVAVFFGEAGFDAKSASPEVVADRVVTSNRFGAMQDADNPDISAFIARGGKLLMYHGLIDTIANPTASTLWYSEMIAAMGEDARDSARLFLAPGMSHCAGGPGPNAADWLGALEAWAERGEAPDSIVAVRNAGGFGPAPAEPLPDMARPLCPFPQEQAHDGQGDPNAPESFSCRAPVATPDASEGGVPL